MPFRLRLHLLGNRLAVRVLGAAPDCDRCFMGAPIARDAQCRHRALGDDGLWCRRHQRQIDRAKR